MNPKPVQSQVEVTVWRQTFVFTSQNDLEEGELLEPGDYGSKNIPNLFQFQPSQKDFEE